MSDKVLELWRQDLEALAKRARLRNLFPREGLDFSSNDYLGLSESEKFKEIIADALARDIPIGATGSRLLRGNHSEHEALEAEAAKFFHSESALFFTSGYTANQALLSTLPQQNDLIFYDALIHASAHDGMRLSRSGHASFPHNDINFLERAIRDWRNTNSAGNPWIMVESLYSMDGDFAPLQDLAEIAEKNEAFLIIDEAHATGVFGPNGRGLAHFLEGAPNIITLHTCGKALGISGGLVCSSKTFKNFLVNRARNFIFATAPSPLIAACVRGALRYISENDDRRRQLIARIEYTKNCLSFLSYPGPTNSQIQPIIIGTDAQALRLAEKLQGQGYDIRAIRPPTVPENSARLRISVTLNVTENQISDMSSYLRDLIEKGLQ